MMVADHGKVPWFIGHDKIIPDAGTDKDLFYARDLPDLPEKLALSCVADRKCFASRAA
jgi:hypothetical protein